MPDYGSVKGVIELHTKIQTVTTITSDIIDNILDRTEARINIRIAHLYTIPVGGGPPALKDIAETLTVGVILRRFHPTADPDPAERWLKDGNELLELIATGSATLVQSNGTTLKPTAATNEIFSNKSTFVPVYSQLSEIEAVIDPDLVEEELRRRDFRT